jgi:hypothetical protein
MAYWVKLIGASDLPVPNAAFKEIPSLANLVRFPRDQFPEDIRRGDGLLYYAVGGYKKLFAAVHLTEDPRRDVPGAEPAIYKRYPHAAGVKLGPHLDFVEFGPDLAAVDRKLPREIRQGVSHFPISAQQFETGVRLIIVARDTHRHSRPTGAVNP